MNSFYHAELIELSRYYNQLKEFMRVFPNRERYLIVDFENLVGSPEDALERCAEFLGIGDEWGAQDVEAQNKTPDRKLALWLDQLGTLKNVLGRLMTDDRRKRVKRFLGRFTSKAGRGMTPSERSRVREVLRADMERFEKEFGFDVSKWGF